jgi:hypothetical protein
MRWFGILLTVVNLLVGAGFVYLASQDWKGRQTIAAAGFRNVLQLTGLPVEPPAGAPEGFDPTDDETPFEIDMGGGEFTRTVGKKLLESYFAANTSNAAPAAGGVALAVTTPVTNQIAEVKRVQAAIKAALAAREKLEDRLDLLRGWLLFQAESETTRVEYLKLLSPNTEAGAPKSPDQMKGDVAKLEAALDRRFAGALAKPQASESPAVSGTAPAADEIDEENREKETDAEPEKELKRARVRLAQAARWREGAAQVEGQRRAKIAHLLIHLDADAAWQKRVAVVVGLRQYADALAAQVPRIADMIREVELAIPGDQAAFVKAETLLRERATQNAERAKAVAEIKAALEAQMNAKVDAVNRQLTQLDNLRKQLAKLKGEVDELLVRQTALETQLLDIQREVGLTLEDVYRLERRLVDAERERFGLPPEAGK